MNTLLQSEIFFFISSIGFVVLFVLIIALLYYLIKISKAFSRITENIEKNINTLENTTKELIRGFKIDSIFNLFFRNNKKTKNNKKKS